MKELKINILFPCDYFDKKIVEDIYKEEYEQVIKFDFNMILFDYDTFIQEDEINIYPNQSKKAPCVPSDLIMKVPKIKSNFYTVDFAQLSSGEWIVIETGDGQVSVLSPNQFIFKYYEEIRLAFCARNEWYKI